MLNNRPVEGGSLVLLAPKGSLPQSSSGSLSVNLPIDDKGQFGAQLVPAVYNVRVRLPKKRSGLQSLYPTGSVLRVTAGGKHQIRLDVRTAQLRLRFQDQDGKPLPGLRALLVPTGSKTRFYLPASDGDGNCTERIPSGSHRLLLPPKHLSTFEGTRAFRKVHGQNYNAAYTKALILLDTLNLAPGSKPDPVQITVPKSAGY